MEPFAVRQGDHGRTGGLQGLAVEVDQAGVAQEGFHPQGAGETGRAGGGQGVVGAGQIVAHCLRAPGT